MHSTIMVLMRELRGYFVSPIAYIVISIFLVMTGWFFFAAFFVYDQAELRGFFSLLPLIFSFFVPAVTMRLFSEEFNTGSYELLMTMPLTERDVILGKFLAATAFVALMLLPTMAYPVMISFVGDLDWGVVIGGYLGALMLGAAFAAVGVFTSSLTRNQIVAFITGMSVCFALTMLDRMLFFLPESALGVLQFMAADYHFKNIARGVVDTRDAVYFLSVASVMLYATRLSLGRRG